MADSPKMKALKNLSNQLPVANQKLAAGQQAARDMQIQSAVKAAPTTANVQQSAAQTGAAVAQSAGQQLIGNAEQSQKAQGNIGQLGLGVQQAQAKSDVSSLQAGAKEAESANVQRLAGISEQAKQEVFDKQMQFNKDEAGRTLFNTRQLADYTALNARNEQDFKNKAQSAQQMSDRALAITQQSYNLVTQELDFKLKQAEIAKDQKLTVELSQMKQAAEEKMAKAKADSANRNSAFVAVGTIVGAVAGAYFTAGTGTAAGAAGGAAVGGAVGSMAASQSE